MREKTYKFRISEVTTKKLKGDNKTIAEKTYYKVERKVMFWWETIKDENPYFVPISRFDSEVDAMLAAHNFVKRETESRMKYEAKRNLKKELKTKVKIVRDFNVSNFVYMHLKPIRGTKDGN